jgi:hypothetical protein
LPGWVSLVFVMVALLAPLALGPALAPLVAELGGASDHACACGMKPGTCGCPECALLAGLEQDAVASVPATDATLATFRACDDHGRAPLPYATPPCIVPALLAVAVNPRAGLLAPLLSPRGVPSQPDAPPTPPPRRSLV